MSTGIRSPLNLNSNKITSLANGTAASDAAAFGQIPLIDSTASDIKPTSTAAAAGAKGQAADASHVHAQNFGGTFGDGSDGALTYDGTTTILGVVPSGNAYTLNRDVFATNLTVNSGVTINTSGFRLFCMGTFTNNGTLSVAGFAASGATKGAGTTANSLGGGGAGGAGTSGAGVQGTAPAGSAGSGSGGAGGSGTPNAGAATQNAATSTTYPLRLPASVLSGLLITGSTNATRPGGGVGGSSGGGDGTNPGGGGGGGGGLIVVCAWSAVNGATGAINVPGGAGGSVSTGNAGGGGGGGGGNIVIYTLAAWTNSGTTNVAGGALGTKAGTGVNGSTGGNGVVLNVIVQ